MMKIFNLKTLHYSYLLVFLSLFIANNKLQFFQADIYFHTHLEIISTILAITVGVIALLRFYTRKSYTFLLLGVGFIGTGILDGYHALVTSYAFKQFMPSELQSLIPWSWLASRFYLSVFYCAITLSFLQKEKAQGYERWVYLYAIVFLLVVFYTLSTSLLPNPYSINFIFSRGSEILPAVMFLVAIISHVKQNSKFDDPITDFFILSIVVNFVVQLPYMANSIEIFDVYFNVAHVFKILSYLLVLVGLLHSIHNVFVKEQRAAALLAKTKKQARETERAAIVENINHGLTLYNHELKLINSNHHFATLFEMPAELLQAGTPMEDIFNYLKNRYKSGPDDRRVSCVGNPIESARQKLTISSQCVFDDEKVVAMSGAPFPNGYVITYDEVTELVNSRQRAVKNSEKLSEIFDTSPIGIFLTCPKSDTIQWINTKGVELFGYQSAAEIIGISLTRHWIVGEIWSAVGNSSIEEENIRSKEVQLKNKSGEKFWCYISAEKIFLEKEYYYLFWVYDITSEKESKERSFRDEKLASLGGLVSGVADEINTPLGVCITATSLISEELKKCSLKLDNNILKKKDLNHFVELSTNSLTHINTNLESAAQLVDKFKDISSIEFVEQATKVHIRHYFQKLLISLKQLIKHTKVEIKLGVITQDKITTFPGALAKVISNLVSNSIQHGFPNGKQGEISLTADVDDNQVLKICFSDNGVGIPESLLSKVMDPFFTTANHMKSNGLGLSIVHNIVQEQLHGCIKLASEEGEGLEVTILIPPKGESISKLMKCS